MLVAPPASTKNTTGNIVLKFPVTIILSQFCVEHQLVHIVTEEENLEHLFRDMYKCDKTGHVSLNLTDETLG